MKPSIGAIALALGGMTPLLGLLDSPSTTPQKTQRPPDPFVSKVQPFVKKYCAACHTGAAGLGGFDATSPKSKLDLAKKEAVWRNAIKRVSDKSMPPAGSLAPTVAERSGFSSTVSNLLGPVKAPVEAAVQSATVRRLNRTEYNNTIRDLFYGMTFAPADDFPSDDIGYGFDNIADVLSVSPLLAERYLDAAQAIARKAIVVPRVSTRSFDESNLRIDGGANVNANIHMYANAVAIGRANFDRSGSYKVRIRAYGQQAGNEPARMELRLDKKKVTVFDVKQVGEPAVYESPVEIEAGSRLIEAAFINDYYAPNDPNPRNRDRNLIIQSIEVIGPIVDRTPVPDSHRKILFVKPASGGDVSAARAILSRFASRAYRRPATKDEVEKLVALAMSVQADKEPFEAGIQLAISAVLASPKFLFRSETEPKAATESARRLSGFELASRLSYFLWSSMPDDELMESAVSGTLVQPQTLSKQVDRMLADPKSRALTQNFATQWLQLRKLESLSPDPELFPTFDDKLRASMIGETSAFFEYVLRQGRPIADFLDSNYAIVDERMAKHYGIEGVTGDRFQRVVLADGRRGGLLTQASVLTVTSNPNRTSPVKRGKYVLEQILGDPPPPPPPGAGVIEGDTDRTPTKSIKERLAKHRADPACSNCHLKMDTIGFAFENFDPIGRWREKDGNLPIDSSGKLPDGTTFKSSQDLQYWLLIRRGTFAEAISEKLTVYALGRALNTDEAPIMKSIVQRTEKAGGTLAGLVRTLATSEFMTHKRFRTTTSSNPNKNP